MKTEKENLIMKVLVAFLLLGASSLSALAQYDLSIAGVEVTSSNCNNVQAPEGSNAIIQGVSYNRSTRTLTLNNAIIDARNVGEGWGKSAIEANGISEGLTIKLIGKNVLYSDYITIYGINVLNIVSGEEGDARPQLNIVGSSNEMFPGIEMYAGTSWGTADINIQGCDVDIVGTSYAIRGFDNYGDGTYDTVALTIGSDASLRVKTTGSSSSLSVFKHVKTVNHDGLTVTMPKNASWSESLMSFTTNGTTPIAAKEARIASYIDFEDNAVKNICVANWDDNSDGRLDRIEARLVTTLEEVFKENTQIQRFDELKYFTGIEILGDGAFQDCTSLESVSLPPMLTEVSWDAFNNDSKLASITIPKYVTNIEGFAFYDCATLSEVLFESGSLLEEIGWLAFCRCPITAMALPNKLKTIREQAFYDNRLERIEIPASVTSIDECAFVQGSMSPSKLATVVVYNAYEPATIGKDCFGVTETGFTGNVPDNFRILIHNSSLTYIQKYKQEWAQYADYIGNRNTYNIFVAGQELAEDNIGSDGSFSYKNGDAEVYGVYYDPRYEKLTMMDGVISSPKNVPGIKTYGKEIYLGLEGDNVINSSSQGLLNADNITIAAESNNYDLRPSLTINSDNAGIYCDNSSNTSDSYQITIRNCELNINSTNGPCVATDASYMEFIGEGPRAAISFSNVKVRLRSPGHIIMKEMGGINLQNGCRILYPENASTNMNGDGIVYDYIDDDYVTDEVRIGSWIDFEDEKTKALCKTYFDYNQDGGVDEWEAAEVKDLQLIFASEDIELFNELRYFTGLEEIGTSAFSNCKNLREVTLPRSITVINVSAFSDCKNLVSCYLHDGITEIGDYAFLGCGNYWVSSLPNTLVTVGSNAFNGCGIENVQVPASTKTIGDYAFYNCMGADFAEGSQIESIGAYAFYGCFNIYFNPAMPATLKSIGDGAFANDPSQGERELVLYVDGTTPATIGTNVFGTLTEDSEIHVPDGKVSIYKQKWAEYKDYILGEEEPIATGITSPAPLLTPQTTVYTLDGRRVNVTRASLPKGIYIINGKKVVIK